MLRPTLIAALAAWAACAQAQEQPDAAPAPNYAEATAPLVVVRFNQRTVYFDRPLQEAVQQALAVKPEVTFDVVLKPGTTNTGDANLSKVTGSLRHMGLPNERIHVVKNPATEETFDEVDVFAK